MRDYLACTLACGTCQHWEGERLPDAKLGRVYTPRHATGGYCRLPGGWWSGRVRQAESACALWQRWGLVRGVTPGRRRFRVLIIGR